MGTSLECFGKVNLTLRITGKRANGYHELLSVFYKIGPFDYLTITPDIEDNVNVIFRRVKSTIQGKNILLKCLETIRASVPQTPRLNMVLEKSVPPGTGLGCASGDAAALLTFLQNSGLDVQNFAQQIGADVPFLCSPHRLALAEGIGEVVQPLESSHAGWVVAVVIPAWRCFTPQMYARLDAFYAGLWPMTPAQARAEANAILQTISRGQHWGLLPNDFSPVLVAEHPEYEQLFAEFKRQKALAWGISGSGSSAFALWSRKEYENFEYRQPWVEDFFIFS